MDDRYDENGNAAPLHGRESERQRDFDKSAEAPTVGSNGSMRRQSAVAEKANTARSAHSPISRFVEVGQALNQADLVAARDSLISALLDRGIDYSDFEIVWTRNVNMGRKLALRTIKDPMPPQLYNSVMAAFEEVGGAPFEGFENMTAIMLAHEAGDWVPIHPRDAEADQCLAHKCVAIESHIHSVRISIADWQSKFGDETEFLCWPAITYGGLKQMCVVISMVDRCFPHTQEGGSNFTPLRAFIRSLPEYRR
jgi:hypothetical protein